MVLMKLVPKRTTEAIAWVGCRRLVGKVAAKIDKLFTQQFASVRALRRSESKIQISLIRRR